MDSDTIEDFEYIEGEVMDIMEYNMLIIVPFMHTLQEYW